MLVYVDDIINLTYDPKEYMDYFNWTYRLKDDIIGPPKRYIWANLNKFQMDNGKEFWLIHCVDYLQGDIINV